jgi:hypothetical protein
MAMDNLKNKSGFLSGCKPPLPCLIAGGKGWEVVTTCVGKLGRFQLVGFTVACTHINVHIYIIYIISGQIGIVHESE